MRSEHSWMVGAFTVYAVVVFLIHTCRFAHAQNLQQLSYANADVAQVLIRPHMPVTTEQPPATTTAKPAGFLSGIRNLFSRNSVTTSTPTPVEVSTIAVPPTNDPHSSSSGIRLFSGPPGSRGTVPTAAPRRHLSTPSPTPPTPAPRAKRPNNEEFPALGAPRRPQPGGVIDPAAAVITPAPTSVWGAPNSPVQHGNFPTVPSTRAPIATPAAKEATSTSAPELATDSEIEDITETLFAKHTLNLLPYINVNLQSRTRSSLFTDDAPLPLLNVNESVLSITPTMIKIRQLFDNYEIDTSVNEYVSPMERQEEAEFLDAVLATPIMKAAMRFLQSKGIVTADPKTHFDMLRTIWFENYSRGMGKVGSSAFEHVFLGETKNYSQMLGQHNWIWYYYKEGQSGQPHSINYMGYMNSVVLGNKGQIVKYRSTFDNLSKPVTAMFIGTLPELDMALYTICFQLKANRGCPVSMAGNKFTIRTHTFKYRGKRLIGSAFPEI